MIECIFFNVEIIDYKLFFLINFVLFHNLIEILQLQTMLSFLYIIKYFIIKRYILFFIKYFVKGDAF